MHEDVHEEQSLESALETTHGREAVRVHVGRLRLALFALRRTGTTQAFAFGNQTVSVRRLREALLAQRSPVKTLEDTSERTIAIARGQQVRLLRELKKGVQLTDLVNCLEALVLKGEEIL